MSEENDSVDEMMAELIGNGFFDLVASPEGEIFYKISDNAPEIAPQLYAMLMNNVQQELLDFAKRGLVEYRFNDDLELEYKFTAAGIEYMESQGYVFEDDE